MLLTLEQLEDIASKASDRNRMKFISPLNSVMEEFNINTPLRIAAFLAQVLHESGSLRYVEELASGSAYEWREDLGNLDKRALRIAHSHGSTTGKFYKGRGLIQITGYYNYLKCEVALQIPCTDEPRLLCKPVDACRSAAWFFESHGCNSLADKEKFSRITKVINGGYNGQSERLAFYKTALDTLA